MFSRIHHLALLGLVCYSTNAFPAYESLAGLSSEEIDVFIRESGSLPGASPPPPPLNDTSSKLVYDAAHPYQAPGPNDLRGPCPGLNTLASHGYLPRSGIVTPQDIVNGVQEGFNMGNDVATFLTWAAFLVNGNHLTNLMSIGAKSNGTGVDPPSPAVVGGLNTHGLFEGDVSMTRGDFAFGDNFHFNETLFDQLVETSNKFGDGKYNATVAAEVRWNRIVDSKARNPTFGFETPRVFTAYAECTFPFRFFVDGRSSTAAMEMTAARSFFQDAKFPDDFYRRNGSHGFEAIVPDLLTVSQPHPISPGYNNGTGNYTVVPDDLGLAGSSCGFYTKHIKTHVVPLYPNPQGALREALKANLATYYKSVGNSSCPELLPYGK